ncbi:MAG TPA: ATP-binding protein [Gemmataceae bacterium]|jgi:hypothetical protein
MPNTSRNSKLEAKLERTMFEESRTKEYFDVRELQTMTGQPAREFAAVILKELVDNGLDAAEKAGVTPEMFIRVRHVRGSLHIAVQDNGGGIAADTIKRILNFTTRTSDKAHYRAPTRGAQGNALKTILGIPYALGSRKPVVVESQAERHFLRPKIDPAGEVSIEHLPADVSIRPGTRFLVAMPVKSCPGFSPHDWARGFALFNPHAIVKIRIDAEEGKLANAPLLKEGRFYYSPTVGAADKWRKFMPDEPTSPHWYDGKSLAKLIFGHINLARKGDASKDLTLREFVMSFKGLSGSLNAAAVCSALPSISRLSDFEENQPAIETLLQTMQDIARVVKADALGLVGEDHFRQRFEEWYGVKRFWYQKVAIEIDNIPYVFEVALAETRKPGRFFHGLNFSPSFEDPFPDTHLAWEDIVAYGAGSFFERAHAHPRSNSSCYTAAAIHLTTPNLIVLDKGKTHVKIPEELAEKIARALWLATKVLYKEEERRRKDAAKQERADCQRGISQARNLPLTEFMEDVMPAALEHATGWKYRVSTHTLFYSARPEFQKYTDRILESQYFEHDLLPKYLRQHPEYAKWLYREPRGVLYEPHTGVEVPLGTREVEAYQFPRWRYDKILFIEKTGLWPIFKEARIAERYDMAIVAGEGVATEACRVLFRNAEKGDYQLFSLHDADPWGYNIARIMREATPRMPGYNVNVCDIGLKLQDALDLGLEPENATRRKSYPKGLVLSDLEREYFDGQQATKKSWIYRRVELNAFTAPQLIEYTERQLQGSGVRGKVIPPAKQLPKLAEPIVRQILGEHVYAELHRLISAEGITRQIAEDFLATLPLGQARQWIKEGFSGNPQLAWDAVLGERIRGVVSERSGEIDAAVLAALKEVAELDLGL